MKKSRAIWILTPLFGTFVYISLYCIAAFLYPGGNQLDKNAKGFSWTQNYWCNLLNEHAMNGQLNTARPVALMAMFVLCITLAAFWYIFPRQVDFSRSWRIAIQLSGVIAMLVGLFIFTNLHDSIINIAGVCALLAVTGTFIGIYKLRWRDLFVMGIFNIILIALNNILYYGDDLKMYLPIVQKITFLFFLLWICLIDIRLFFFRYERR
ncbi:hypothetical protein GFS24_02320 [Chitinophaga sp. SYP-B3965]|uniref:hypothetical protein n=1 Tax=Chitinophaga sp. SYP-B3965 TaxID=2663120 RepID=UPI0012999975|nr:hypothetical protein [Chitinophaga sp. SYP-B3965]MRG43928.1 hypothetical protein [Chitinophaga sp. SYP-B3965]